MADAMLKAAQAAYDGNEQFIEMLAAQLKAAKARKKILREEVKRQKANLKEHLKAMKAGAVSAAAYAATAGGAAADGGDAAPAPVVRRYADNYQNRKLGRVGQVIPSRKKKKPTDV